MFRITAREMARRRELRLYPVEMLHELAMLMAKKWTNHLEYG